MFRIWNAKFVRTLYRAPVVSNATGNIIARNLCKEKSFDNTGTPTYASGKTSTKPINKRPVPPNTSLSQKSRSFRINHPPSRGLIYVILGKKTNGTETYLFIEKIYMITKPGTKL